MRRTVKSAEPSGSPQISPDRPSLSILASVLKTDDLEASVEGGGRHRDVRRRFPARLWNVSVFVVLNQQEIDEDSPPKRRFTADVELQARLA